MHKRWSKIFSWFALTILTTVSVFWVQQNATLLRTSLIPTITHKPFDGTVYPIQKAPNWSQLTTEEYKNVYTAIPSGKFVSTPYYNPSDFLTSFESLKWGDPNTEDLRNAKITYSVPYMGDYSLDSIEYAGSHLAVDIKIPKGTPVFAIGNGVVSKVSTQSSGFGSHIVIEHRNFPTLDDQNKFTTYYSSYSHLDSVLVAEGQVVDKGNQIGLSGESGTATTPHLHFQIDTGNANWHPYWPFTWQEANSAGLDFFTAVNAGLGRDTAMATTINPLMYVQKYLDPSASIVESAAVVVVAATEPVVEPVVVVEPVEPAVEPVVEANPEKVEFEVVVRSFYEEDVTAYFTIHASEVAFDGLVNLSLTSDIGTLEKTRLSASDFDDGKVKLSMTDLKLGKSKIKVAYGQDVFYSDLVEVTPVEEEPQEIASSFSDVSASHGNYEAITYLAENGVISGYPDGTFRPDNTVTRAEALRFVLEGIHASIEIGDLPFKDVAEGEWYYKYVSTAHLRSIVAGYPDGSFRAGNVVSRAEFMKILLTAMDVKVSKNLKEDPFKDVDKDTWFAPYFDYAKDNGIIDSGLRAWPSTGMKRSDVAEAMWRVMLD